VDNSRAAARVRWPASVGIRCLSESVMGLR